MKKFLTSVFMLSMVLFSMNVFNSCKDYDEDEYNDLIADFNRNDANLRTWIKTNYATIAQLKRCSNQNITRPKTGRGAKNFAGFDVGGLCRRGLADL